MCASATDVAGRPAFLVPMVMGSAQGADLGLCCVPLSKLLVLPAPRVLVQQRSAPTLHTALRLRSSWLHKLVLYTLRQYTSASSHSFLTPSRASKAQAYG